MTALPRLAEIFADLASVLVDAYNLNGFFAELIARVEELTPARATGLMMADETNELQLAATTPGQAHELEVWQTLTGQGPCFDCYRTGAPIVNGSLSAGSPWPQFAAYATAVGYDTVHAFPLRQDGHVIGAMNLFSTDHAVLSDEQARVVQGLCDFAAIAVVHKRAQQRSEQLARELQMALDSRVVIEQAKGAVAQMLGISVDDAFAWLRTRARRDRVRLNDLAAAVLAGPASGAGPP